ncbi:MAG TPA: hypothetical protein VKA82_09915 [Rubrobacter sp.]|jgi:hypothetical protein|nr:hypothetical protein [Rubrobacter sp.]
MAARLLLLVVMLVFAALYGCAQEAAKDRQPMKRIKEPTTAKIAPHAPEESDDHVRRAKEGVVVRAGNSAVVARDGEAVVRVGGFKTAKGEGTDATAPSREVTLKIEGSPGTEFSGTCVVGGKEKKVSGRVPKRFIYETDGQRLECEISKQSSNTGQMKVEFSAKDHTNSVQQSSTQGDCVTLRYESHGSTGLLSSSTSVSGNQANSTSQVSVLQSNAASGKDSH